MKQVQYWPCGRIYSPIRWWAFGRSVESYSAGGNDLPPKKESSYNVSKFGQKEGG